MAKTEMIRARMEPELKHEAEALFEEVGLSPTQAITLFYRQVTLRRGLPFHARVPNAKTRKVLNDMRKAKGVKTWKSLAALKKAFD
jgi:DNA-damage-inducible protein J